MLFIGKDAFEVGGRKDMFAPPEDVGIPLPPYGELEYGVWYAGTVYKGRVSSVCLIRRRSHSIGSKQARIVGWTEKSYSVWVTGSSRSNAHSSSDARQEQP